MEHETAFRLFKLRFPAAVCGGRVFNQNLENFVNCWLPSSRCTYSFFETTCNATATLRPFPQNRISSSYHPTLEFAFFSVWLISNRQGEIRVHTDQSTYRVTHLLAEKVMLTSVPSQDKLSMRRNWCQHSLFREQIGHPVKVLQHFTFRRVLHPQAYEGKVSTKSLGSGCNNLCIFLYSPLEFAQFHRQHDTPVNCQLSLHKTK